MPKIRLDDQRLAFPAIFQPQGFADGKPAYGGKLIIVPKSKAEKQIKEAMRAAAFEQPKWKGKEEAILAKLVKDGLVCFHEDEYTDKNGDVYAGFEDMHYLNMRSEKLKPIVLDRKKQPLVESDGRPYGGCYVNASVEIWPQDNAYGRRINCTLVGVQFNRDGDAFSGGTPATPEDFEDLSDGVDDELENDLA